MLSSANPSGAGASPAGCSSEVPLGVGVSMGVPGDTWDARILPGIRHSNAPCSQAQLVPFECPKLLSPAGGGSGITITIQLYGLLCGASSSLVAHDETLERRALMEYYTSTFFFLSIFSTWIWTWSLRAGAMGRSYACLSVCLITFGRRTATCRPRISDISL